MACSGVDQQCGKSFCRLSFIFLLAVFHVGCNRSPSNRLQGYIEGEFVYVSAPLSGSLEKLTTHRGAQVTPGEPLFVLEHASEQAGRDEAALRLQEGRALLADAKKGKRPSEIRSLEAQLKQAEVAVQLSEKEQARQERLGRAEGATTQQEIDRARATRELDLQRRAQVEADLETARLSSRTDQISAAEANVRALEAALVTAAWNLDQKSQRAPQGGVVYDTLYRAGEWVAAGRPVVAILPPAQVKLRVFVPEPWLGGLKVGDQVQVFVDGTAQPYSARLNFISPRAEFTPPVIYSRENRTKFVFLIEAVFEAATAGQLHPGQPVEVQFDRAPSR